MTGLDFPYAVDGTGRTAGTDVDGHVRDLVEQVLFTAPGERVMRPDFGSGLAGLVFEPAGAELVATTQYLVQSALQQWLGGVVTVESVDVRAADGVAEVTVRYTVLRTQASVTATFRHGGAT